MSRFEELARLKELEAKATAAPWAMDTQFDPKDVLRNAKLEIGLRNAAPWLLKIAEAFQPGTSEVLSTAIILLVASGASEDSIMIDCLKRLQAAAEELER